jgi:hypothetical protein
MISREPDKLFKKFVDDFPTLKLKSEKPDTEWTKKIFDYFSVLGKTEGFEAFCANDPYEYLLDMCWIYTPKNTSINWIEAGFEIEWSRDLDYITDEFAKLVDIKAYTKVLLCFPKADEVDDLVSETSEMIRYNPLKVPEERYLIIALVKIRKKASFAGFVFDLLEISLLGDLVNSQRKKGRSSCLHEGIALK